jgi:hypothetical protein
MAKLPKGYQQGRPPVLSSPAGKGSQPQGMTPRPFQPSKPLDNGNTSKPLQPKLPPPPTGRRPGGPRFPAAKI